MVNNVLATIAFVLLVAGWTQRKRVARHVPLVLTGMALDVALVLWLEVTRGVVESVAGAKSHDPYSAARQWHIATSTLAVVLYIPTFVYGWRLWRRGQWPDAASRERARKAHAACALSALAARSAGFVFMWMA
jgi:uncharacterized membrane protein YozB (DUF420 family)